MEDFKKFYNKNDWGGKQITNLLLSWINNMVWFDSDPRFIAGIK